MEPHPETGRRKHKMTRKTIGRRTFLRTGIATAAVAGQTAPARAADNDDTFVYAVTRTEAEWRARLTETEYFVLREGGTETPESSPLWNNRAVGTYCCRGCDLTLYDSLQKIQIDKGWAFFRHSRPDTMLTSLDLNGGSISDPFARLAASMEVHCRRCGSHLGHIVVLPEVPDKPLHCINGHALDFRPAST